jgi:hypothetical protein
MHAKIINSIPNAFMIIIKVCLPACAGRCH